MVRCALLSAMRCAGTDSVMAFPPNDDGQVVQRGGSTRGGAEFLKLRLYVPLENRAYFSSKVLMST